MLKERVKPRYNSHPLAAVAQLVERNLAKVEVESSRLFSRSRFKGKARTGPSLFHLGSALALADAADGGMAEWSCSGLQSRVRRFDSDSRLHTLHVAHRPMRPATARIWRGAASQMHSAEVTLQPMAKENASA